MNKYLIALFFVSNVALANGTYDMAMNEGCESGKNASGETWHKFQKDVDRYIKDPYYKTGWDDGYAKCKAQSDNINNIITDSLNRGW